MIDKPGARHALKTRDPLFSPNTMNVIGYGPSGFDEVAYTRVSDIAEFANKWPVTWVDVDGLGNSELILAIGKELGLPILLLEDVFNTNHQPKIEIYEKLIFIIFKNGIYAEAFETEQISMVLMDKMVITFQERPGDSFSQVRGRIRDGMGKMRQFGSDYLAYALMDAVVEGYYPILEALKKKLDMIEDSFITEKGTNVIRHIHDVKNDLLYLHSAVWPIRDITMALSHDDLPAVTASTHHNLRDCQDQAKQVTDLTEFYRLIASDLMNTYLAFSDHKANEVMKVLTMVATIFIPLSFLTGLYGMNWDRSSPYNMPELGYRYGYPAILGVMLFIVIGILTMFWRSGWIGKRRG